MAPKTPSGGIGAAYTGSVQDGIQPGKEAFDRPIKGQTDRDGDGRPDEDVKAVIQLVPGGSEVQHEVARDVVQDQDAVRGEEEERAPGEERAVVQDALGVQPCADQAE